VYIYMDGGGGLVRGLSSLLCFGNWDYFTEDG